MTNRARRNAFRATAQRVDRKKMYKAKKRWIVAGMSLLVAMGIGMTAQTNTHADSINNNAHATVTQTLNNESNQQAKNNQSTNTDSVTKQASALHSRILANNAGTTNNVSSVSTNTNTRAQNNNVSSATSQASSSATSNVQASNSVAKASNNTQSFGSVSIAPSVKSNSAKVSTTTPSSVAPVSATSVSNTKVSSANSNVTNNAQNSDAQSNSSANSQSTVQPSATLTSKVNQANVGATAPKTEVAPQATTGAVLHGAPVVRNGGNYDGLDFEGTGSANANVPSQHQNANSYSDTQPPHSENTNNMNLVTSTNWDNAKVNWYSDGQQGNGAGDLMEVAGGTIKPQDEPKGIPTAMGNATNLSNWRLKIDPGTVLSDEDQAGAALGRYFSGHNSPSILWDHFKSMDLSGLDVSNVRDMGGMFESDAALQNLDLSNWNTNSAVMMTGMFSSDPELQHININSFTTPKVSDMANMFSQDPNLQSIAMRNFSMNDAQSDSQMFDSDNSLNKILINTNSIKDQSDNQSSQSSFFSDNVDSDGNSSTNALAKGKPSHDGWYYRVANTPVRFVHNSDKSITQTTGKSLDAVVSPDSNYYGYTGNSIASLNLGAITPEGYNILSQQSYTPVTVNGDTYVPVLISKADTNSNENIHYNYPDNKGGNHNEGNTTVNGKKGSNDDITPSNAPGLPNGWHLPNNNNNVPINGGSDNVPVVPNQANADVHYIVNNIKDRNNGKDLGNHNFIGNWYLDHDAGNNDVVVSPTNDPGVPAGYHLQTNGFNYKFPYNNGNDNAYIIGNWHNKAGHENTPSSDKPTNPSDLANLVTVHEKKFVNGNYVGTDTRYIVPTGRTGETYDVSPVTFDPQGFTVDPADQDLKGVFTPSGISNNNVTWRYNMNAEAPAKLGSITVNYTNENGKAINSISTAGQAGHYFDIRPFEANVPQGYHFDKITSGANINKFNDGNQAIIIQVAKDQPIIKHVPTPNKPKVSDNNVIPQKPVTPPKPNNNGNKIPTVSDVDEIPQNTTANYKGYSVTRVHVPSHWRWFDIVSTCLAHREILNVGNNKTYAYSMKPHHVIYHRIDRIFLVHSKKSNRVLVRYEFRDAKRTRLFVTGDEHYTQNNYFQANDFANARKFNGTPVIRIIRNSREYTSPRYNNKTFVRNLKRGTKVAIKRVFFIGRKGDYQTRFQLTNGHYVTANKNNVEFVK